ncbi:5-histidylcysteine sulfoxide synthase/putative 4-mercaptohistidine N1-methyltransferase [Marinobacter subterrani]|uniref:5-histidylcysteine sulfoxide synthase/putative 4-mercaptohistidine N1-methyltransferase n=2 Tax=Marinobacter subterrani TaxID=1658765 RepID=A0A0J7JE69_9GAMM|nr:5-histidylcysteine sulfoxide synthase/putative 4-mercaptohistidine N1-methyltransferase [Marinobacter subterrani]
MLILPTGSHCHIFEVLVSMNSIAPKVSALIQSEMNGDFFPRSVNLVKGHVDTKRKEILYTFLKTFDKYESLFTLLKDEQAFYEKPIELRHPLIFYLGHTAVFFINKLLLAKVIEKRINPKFESMFAVGVDEMSWDDLDESHYYWPPLEEVMAYRRMVRRTVANVIRSLPMSLPIDWDSAFWPILMGIDHERIHLETSSVLIRQHQLSRVKKHTLWSSVPYSGNAPCNELLPVSAGTVTLGIDNQAEYYAWDNEYGTHEAEVESFEASKYLVSNREFFEFFKDNGYLTDKYWSEEGLQWREFSNVSHPTFWVWRGEWHLRLLAEEVPMRWDWPVEVNFHEAKAFCVWKSEKTGSPIRLPTEDEWYRLVDEAGVKELADERAKSNLHLDYGASSCPVNWFQHGAWFDVVGNVWQWTETPTYPFEGFKVHPLYDDFTTPTFDNQHMLMKGGSWISTGNEARLSSRYAFRAHFFQHAGFRYVASNAKPKQQYVPYEHENSVSKELDFHYGPTYLEVSNFHQNIVEELLPFVERRGRALDIGCSCGRSSFELARLFETVEGVDFSANYIQKAWQIAETGQVRYVVPTEGDLVDYREANLNQLSLAETASRVHFSQSDASNLRASLVGFDLILAVNVIDRIHDPVQFLTDMSTRLHEGGILVIASSYDWDHRLTPRKNWLGGFKKDGESLTTLEGLKQALQPSFELINQPQQIPFARRETQNRFQFGYCELTIWKQRVVGS